MGPVRTTQPERTCAAGRPGPWSPRPAVRTPPGVGTEAGSPGFVGISQAPTSAFPHSFQTGPGAQKGRDPHPSYSAGGSGPARPHRRERRGCTPDPAVQAVGPPGADGTQACPPPGQCQEDAPEIPRPGRAVPRGPRSALPARSQAVLRAASGDSTAAGLWVPGARGALLPLGPCPSHSGIRGDASG